MNKELKPGYELNVIVAEKVLGLHKKPDGWATHEGIVHHHILPDYSYDTHQAFNALFAYWKKTWFIGTDNKGKIVCHLSDTNCKCVDVCEHEFYFATSKTVAHAISLVLVKAAQARKELLEGKTPEMGVG